VANFTEWNGNMEQLCKSSLHCLVFTNYTLLDRACRAPTCWLPYCWNLWIIIKSYG